MTWSLICFQALYLAHSIYQRLERDLFPLSCMPMTLPSWLRLCQVCKLSSLVSGSMGSSGGSLSMFPRWCSLQELVLLLSAYCVVWSRSNRSARSGTLVCSFIPGEGCLMLACPGPRQGLDRHWRSERACTSSDRQCLSSPCLGPGHARLSTPLQE